MNRFSLEVKVGIVVSVTVALILVFLFFLSGYNPFAKSYRIYVLYNFAGGIELGSPVRVAGVKVGKVDQIKFFEPGHKFQGEPVSISIRLLIDRRAQSMVRRDSKFYINMAGIIGEKYIEITPGSQTAPVLENGETVRGIDPPRLEQFLSQGYGVFEKISKKLESISEKDKEKFKKMFEDLACLVENLAKFSRSIEDLTKQAQKIQGLVNQTQLLLTNLNLLLEPIVPKTPEQAKQYQARLDQLSDTINHLSSLAERLDRASARLEVELEGVTKESIERTIRQILQQEGITINVGTVIGKPKYPPLPTQNQNSSGDK